MNKTLQKILTRINQLEQKMETHLFFKYIHRIRGNYLGDYTVCISQLICFAQSEIDDGEVKESVKKYISVSLYIFIYCANKSNLIQSNGVNLLQLRAVNPEMYALALMDALFSDEDMAQCCFIPSKKSVKAPLCENKTKIITL